MASRVTKRRRFLREFRWVYQLVFISLLFGAAVTVWIKWPETWRAPEQKRVEQSDAQKYAGMIVVPTDHRETCQFFALDNRTGGLSEKGYGPCETKQRPASRAFRR